MCKYADVRMMVNFQMCGYIDEAVRTAIIRIFKIGNSKVSPPAGGGDLEGAYARDRTIL
jgi:hypothetical protein